MVLFSILKFYDKRKYYILPTNFYSEMKVLYKESVLYKKNVLKHKSCKYKTYAHLTYDFVLKTAYLD